MKGYTLAELSQTFQNDGLSLGIISENGTVDLLSLNTPLDQTHIAVTTGLLSTSSTVITIPISGIAPSVSAKLSD